MYHKNLIIICTIFTIITPLKVGVHVIHVNCMRTSIFPSNLGLKSACVLYKSAYYNRIFVANMPITWGRLLGGWKMPSWFFQFFQESKSTAVLQIFYCSFLWSIIMYYCCCLCICVLLSDTLLSWLGSSFSPERQEDARQHGWKISHNEGLEGNALI